MPDVNHSLQLRFLGVPEVAGGEVTVRKFRSRRVPALLAFLTVENSGSAPREKIAAALWPDRDPESARQNLRQTLLYARAALAQVGRESSIEADRLEVWIAGEYRTDVDSFRQSSTEGDLVGAAQLYRGQYLEGIDDVWAETTRAQISFKVIEVWMALAEQHRATAPERALEYAVKAIGEDPYRDEAWALRIEMLRQMGKPTEARRQYTRFRDLLERDLGLSPAGTVQRALRGDEPDDTAAKLPRTQLSPVRSLAQAGKFKQAWDLAAALTPYWIHSSLLTVGIDEWTHLLESAPQDWPSNTRAAALWHRAELKLYHGDGPSGLSDAMLAWETASPNDKPGIALTIAKLYSVVRRLDEVRRWSLTFLRAQRRQPGSEKVSAGYCVLAQAALLAGDYERGRLAARRAIAAAQSSNDVAEQVQAWVALGNIDLLDIGSDAGRKSIDEASRLLDSPGAPKAPPLRLWIGRLQEDLGILQEAEAAYRAGIADFRDSEQSWMLGIALTYYGDLLTESGKASEAIPHFVESIEIRNEIGDVLGLATSHRGLGKAHAALHHWEEARTSLRESIRLFREVKDMPGVASSAMPLAEVEHRLRNFDVARKVALRAVQIYLGLGPAERAALGRRHEAEFNGLRDLISQLTGNST